MGNDKFKVDLRICLSYNNKDYDLFNLELKKDGNISQSITEVEGKVLVEGKTILNSLCEKYNSNLEGAKKLEVLVGQFCGLKGIFKGVALIAPGAYQGYKWGKTLKYPIREKMID